MNELVNIMGVDIHPKEYKGRRVVTFKDIDAVHGRPDGTARKRFNDNKDHFIEGEDFYKITPSEFRTAIGDMDRRQQNDITLITETGYLMIVKSFTDDRAWKVQRMLVKGYFAGKKLYEEQVLKTGRCSSDSVSVEGCQILIREWNNERVIDINMVDKLHAVMAGTARRAFNQHRGYAFEGIDFYRVSSADAKYYFNEVVSNEMILLTKSGYTQVVDWFNTDFNERHDFVKNEFLKKYFNTTDGETKKLGSMIRCAEIMASCTDANRPYVVKVLKNVIPDIDEPLNYERLDAEPEKVFNKIAELKEDGYSQDEISEEVKQMFRFVNKACLSNPTPFQDIAEKTYAPFSRRKLNNHMKRTKTSTKQLSSGIHVSVATISAWRNGRHKPSENSLKSLCEFFNVSDDFFCRG